MKVWNEKVSVYAQTTKITCHDSQAQANSSILIIRREVDLEIGILNSATMTLPSRSLGVNELKAGKTELWFDFPC